MHRRGAWLAGAAAAALAATLAATATARPEASAAPPTRVIVVTDGGCSTVSTLRLCESLRAAMRRTGVTGRVVAPSLRENVDDFLGLIARQGYERVILFSLYFNPAVGAVMKRHPNVRFAIIDGSARDVPGRPRNVRGVIFRTSEAAYLAGWLAGKLEQRRAGPDVVGVVGGLPIPTVRDFAIGFAAGARRAAPGITVLEAYSNDWLDRTKCGALARRQIARGAGTVFNVAGECGLGTLDAAREAGIWGVGVDSDQASLGPHVLTSVLKNFEAGFVTILREVQEHRVSRSRDTVLTMRDGAVGLGRISPKVPRPLVTQLETVRRRIVAGEIRVPGAIPRPVA
jgi:basic membrane protein A